MNKARTGAVLGCRSLLGGGRSTVLSRTSASSFRQQIQRCRRLICSSNATLMAVKIQHAQTQPVYQDSTLLWAQQNPQLAQTCLNPPTFDDIQHCDSNFNADKPTSLEAYLEWRKWVLPEELQKQQEDNNSKDNTDKAVALISHVLSTPLTLASQFGAVGSTMDDGNDSKQNWCCVGARAEASLPSVYWKEFLLLGSAQQLSVSDDSTTKEPSPPKLDVSLQFTGPDIPPKLPDQTVKMGSCGTIALQAGFRGLYHDIMKSTESSEQFNGYLFFNPGFAHPNHRSSWEVTLDKIFQEIASQISTGNNCSMLITAHSKKDAARDAALMEKTFGLTLDYKENPFASRVSYQDPFDNTHIVRPNHYVATWSTSSR